MTAAVVLAIAGIVAAFVGSVAMNDSRTFERREAVVVVGLGVALMLVAVVRAYLYAASVP